MEYAVKIESEGRGGWVYYREDGHTLPFDWDITSDGFEVYTPTAAEWRKFCDDNHAPELRERRQQILERVAEEVRKKRGKRANITVDEMGIHFSYAGNRLYSLMSRLLGV